MSPRARGIGYAEEQAPTLTVGQTAEVFTILGNAIGRSGNAGLNGFPISDENVSPTLTTADRHAVAFTQNQRDEVRLCGGDGQVAGALSAQPGAKQQSYVCMADQTANAAIDYDMCGTLHVGGCEPIVMAPSFSRRPAQQLPTNSDGLSFALTRGGVPRVCESGN